MRRTPAAFLCLHRPSRGLRASPAGTPNRCDAPGDSAPTAKAGIADGRGRFREIYCAVRADHGAKLPFDRPCDASAALWRLPGEPPPSGHPVALEPSSAGLTVVMVPGLLAECLVVEVHRIRRRRAPTCRRRATRPATSRPAAVRPARSTPTSSATRSAHVGGRAHRPGHPLQGHRQFPAGARDLSRSRRQGRRPGERGRRRQRLAARRHRAGLGRANGGSDRPARVPAGPRRRGSRQPAPIRAPDVAATHAWPASVRTYSLVAVAGPNDMSAVLRPFADILSRTEPANDGLVVASDAIVPGSTLLGYAHADHLAIAMPFRGQRAAAWGDADDAQRLPARRAVGGGDPVCRGGFARLPPPPGPLRGRGRLV